jgi:hypothetical protein
MRNLLKKPLLWMILAECAVVSALVFVAWHMFTGPSHEAAASRPLPIAAAATDDPSNPPTAVSPPPASPAARLQLPGLNLDTDFWRLRLLELNKEEVVVEQLEWRIVHSTMDTIHRYLDTVVLPGVARAERGGG